MRQRNKFVRAHRRFAVLTAWLAVGLGVGLLLPQGTAASGEIELTGFLAGLPPEGLTLPPASTVTARIELPLERGSTRQPFTIDFTPQTRVELEIPRIENGELVDVELVIQGGRLMVTKIGEATVAELFGTLANLPGGAVTLPVTADQTATLLLGGLPNQSVQFIITSRTKTDFPSVKDGDRVTVELTIATGRLIALEIKTSPLADLHFHPSAVQAFSPEQALRAMDRAGVRWAGNGAKGLRDLDRNWLPFVQAAPDRFLPFAGQGGIGELIRNQGADAFNLVSPEIMSLADRIEQDLRAGRFRGIGELFVNNLTTRPATLPGTRYPADSPLMQRLLSLAATFHAPLSIHMEAEPTSVEELERLLPMNREGIVVWAHCGHFADASLVRGVLARHPNLFCELSFRDDIRLRGRNLITDSNRRVLPDWKDLLEAFSDRFLIGTDPSDDLRDYQQIVEFFRTVLAQLTPKAANRIGQGNARRIFRL